MRRTLLAVAVSAGLLLASGSAALPSPPSLRLLSLHPVSVRGLHFKPRERARLVLVTPVRRERSATADPAGAFVVTFTGTSADRCTGLVVVARGSLGSRAVLKRTAAQTECPAPAGSP